MQLAILRVIAFCVINARHYSSRWKSKARLRKAVAVAVVLRIELKLSTRHCELRSSKMSS
jgi:hypothetical protein